MTGAELGFATAIGVIALILVVTVVVAKANSKEINNMRNTYLGRLASSDASEQNATKYLKLTNGVKQLNGDKRKPFGKCTA